MVQRNAAHRRALQVFLPLDHPPLNRPGFFA